MSFEHLISMKQFHIIFFLLFFLSASSVSAVTLTETVRRIWDQSPQLKAQQEQVEISRWDVRRRWIPNEPQFQYSNTDDGTAESLGLQETVAFPGKTFSLARLDQARQKSQSAELLAKKYELARNAVQVYLDGSIAAALVEEQKKNIADLETLAASLKARYEAGMASQPEWTVIELQLKQQRADLAAQRDKTEVAAFRLKQLLRLEKEEEVHYQLPDDIDADLIVSLGGGTADELRAEAAIALARAGEQTASWSVWPDFTLGIAKNRYLYLPGSPSGKEETFNYSLAFTLPLLFPVHERIEAKRARSQSALDRSAAELQLQAALADRKDAAREYERSKGRLQELREKDLPLAESLMESTFSAYKSGRLGIAEVVLARKTLTDLRTQEVQLRASVVLSHLRCLNSGGF